MIAEPPPALDPVECPYCQGSHRAEFVDEIQDQILACRAIAIAKGWRPNSAEMWVMPEAMQVMGP